jgi:hypothetical protein
MRHLLLVASLAACSSVAGTRTVTTVGVRQQVVVATDPVATVASPGAPLVVATNGSSLRCSPPQRALAGTPVHLRAEGPAGLRYRWSVTRSPQARYYRFSERFDANDSDGIVALGAEVPFTSVIVGDYTVRVDARDADGNTSSCETEVTMAGHGLRVELSWNTDATDVDLHMTRGSSPQWVTPQDCYYGNRRPDDANADESRRRWLDTDDVDGEGPENIRVDVPELDEEYRVGVHFYSSHGSSDATTAIVVIHCGEQQVARFERALHGNRSPDENEFWRVAGVRFRPDGSCVVAPPRGAAVMSQQQVRASPDAT